eukprot:g1507.t1
MRFSDSLQLGGSGIMKDAITGLKPDHRVFMGFGFQCAGNFGLLHGKGQPADQRSLWSSPHLGGHATLFWSRPSSSSSSTGSFPGLDAPPGVG